MAARWEWGAVGRDVTGRNVTVRGVDKAFPSGPSLATPDSVTPPHCILLHLSVLS